MAYPNSQPFPDKWRLEGFESCLSDWQGRAEPPAEVHAAAQRWTDTRQDDYKGGAVPLPDEGTDEDSIWFLAYLFDFGGHAITVDGRQVTCSYEVFPTEHKIVCGRFSHTGEA
jgi:hypothetical protein